METVPIAEFAYRHNQSYKGRYHDSETYTHTACGELADKERDKDECHSCSDWSGCGGDCQLSGVRCLNCQVRADV
jgi:hypothetical protein